jgi:hypothetical protein
MTFLDALFAKTGFRRQGLDTANEAVRDAVLFVSTGDAGWSAELADAAGSRWKQQMVCAPENDATSPPEQLAIAMARLSAEQPQANVTRIVLLIDDPDLQLVDHRFAKLTNFEPRALKEFGAQQAGGRPVVFGSLPFGASSAREIEKRVLGFLPEEKFGSYFFSLGKLATALAAVIPAGVHALRSESHAGGIFATLRMHGHFSTLLIANGDTGIVAVRQFAFGTLSLAKAYAAEYGLSLEESSASLKIRSRLPPALAMKDDGVAPEHMTATFEAVFPYLRQLRDDIAATLDYFRYQRLAGRPAHLTLTFTAPVVAGLDTWLAEALDLQVDMAPNALPTFEDVENPTLNLLDGSRPGLLKLGNQPYEFSHGRLVPITGGPFDMPAPKSGSASKLSIPWLEKILAHTGERFELRRDRIMQPVLAVALAVLFVIANLYFLTMPAQQRLTDSASIYDTAAGSTLAAGKTAREADLAGDVSGALWADSLLSVGKALAPGMKLKRIELVPSAGKTGAAPDLNFAVTGTLPPAGADLKLVAGFIDRLSRDASFSRRFAQLRFTGAAESQDEARHEMLFHVVGLSGSARK